MPMKLSDWAKKMNISYETAWRWKRDGKIPFPVEKVGNTVMVMDDHPKPTTTELHCPKCGEIVEVELR